jgi:phosphate transport system protein
LARLIDPGIEMLRNMLRDMAALSERSVETAIAAYAQNRPVTKEIFEWSEELSLLHNQASDLAVELIARYQPVASDLRYIKSCFEISYGFERLGRYAYDVAQIIDAFGDLSNCDNTEIRRVGDMVRKMVHQGAEAFFGKDIVAAEKLKPMDDVVDESYREHIRRMASQEVGDPRCSVAVTLVMRYLERMADHACYMGDSAIYVVTGSKRSIR